MATKGIAIFVPGADYSRSPFGKVTLTPTIDEEVESIVSTYTTKIGDTTSSTALKAMVKSLIKAGVWNNLDLYPMLGSTLAHTKVNLNPDNGFTKGDLLYGTNATKSSDGVLFEKIANANTGLPARTMASLLYDDMDGLFVATDVIKDANTTGAARIYNNSLQVICSSSGYVMGFGVGSSQNTYTTTPATSRHMFSFGIDDSKCKVYVDKTLENTSDTLTFTAPGYNWVNVIGCTVASGDTSASFGGTCRFWAAGKIDPSKFDDVNTIIKSFLDAVKPLA